MKSTSRKYRPYTDKDRLRNKLWRKKNREKCREYSKMWIKNNPEKYKAYRRKTCLKNRYGITIEEYQQLLEQQNGVCAICNRSQTKTYHVDHNRRTKKVRGLLCMKCNRGIGLLGDNVENLKRAIEYLIRSDI